MRQWKDKASAAQPSAFGLPKFNKLYPMQRRSEPLFVCQRLKGRDRRYVIQLLSQSYNDAPSAKQVKRPLVQW